METYTDELIEKVALMDKVEAMLIAGPKTNNERLALAKQMFALMTRPKPKWMR